MPVEYIRREVASQLAKWTMIRDCLAGQQAVKDAGVKYLPKPNPEDTSAENSSRYKTYLERAVYYNVSRRTLDALVGQVFIREPITSTPDSLHALQDNADGIGVGLNQQAKKTLAEVMSYGRAGLLTDFPPMDTPATKQDVDNGYVRPTISLFHPWDVINWQTVVIGARQLLSLVVIVEPYITDDDGFSANFSNQWRVLRLVGTGPDRYYQVEIWRTVPAETPDKAATNVLFQTYQPKDASGKPFREIPFTFIGSINNDPTVDHAPLYDLVTLNIAHYRNSADYEESCYLVGQPTPYAAGLTEHWVKEVLKGSIQLGSRAVIPLPEGGIAGLLQVQPNSMPFEAMQHKERQMVALGARLLEQKDVQRTYGEAQLEEASQMSILTSVATNVSAAYELALLWAAAFTEASVDEEEIEYDLNTDFPASRMSPEERRQLVAEWQGSAIAFSEMRKVLVKAGVAELSDEEAQKEIKENPPPLPVTAKVPNASEPRKMDKKKKPNNNPAAVSSESPKV